MVCWNPKKNDFEIKLSNKYRLSILSSSNTIRGNNDGTRWVCFHHIDGQKNRSFRDTFKCLRIVGKSKFQTSSNELL